jgi:FtsP/CotA-like multicopper oxidase with cupredoxin domain
MKKNTLKVSLLLILAVSMLSALLTTNLAIAVTPDAPTLDPLLIPKFVNQLVIPPVYLPKNIYQNGKLIRQDYTVDMTEFFEQILPTKYANGTPTGFGMSLVWGYGGNTYDPLTGKVLGYVRNSPGPSFVATRGIPTKVTYINKLTRSIYAVDPTLMWANPNKMGMVMPPINDFPPGYLQAQMPVPVSPHLHGGEVQSTSDGGPFSWFTANGLHGPNYNTAAPTSANSVVDYYPNEQEPTLLWYHDHAMGMTRLNVYSGLAGFYVLKDNNDWIAKYLLPYGKYDIPLAIQDRSFNQDGTMWFPSTGVTDYHPYWNPEFFGNTIMVNGKVWPNLNVDRGQYQFHLLDGSNARFYNFSFVVKSTGQTLPFTLIGTEGGYIRSPVTLKSLLIAPAERPDVLVDFSNLAPGTKVILMNNAPAPNPQATPGDTLGDPTTADFKKTVGQIMQFTVGANHGRTATSLPEILNPTLRNPLPNADQIKRLLPLKEQEDPVTGNPIIVTLNGQSYSGTLTETPRVGSTEDWYIINLTPDTHPIHVHLVMFQLYERIPFNATKYSADWLKKNAAGMTNGMLPFKQSYVPTELPIASYLTGPPVYPTASEKAWKDTVQVPPNTITVLRIRFAPQDAPLTGAGSPSPGVNLYPFNPTVGPGYVWHCHIIDHEDNEMMRPYKVMP